MIEPTTKRLRVEVLIVLGLSLGQSGIFASWKLVERYLSPKPIGSQTATLRPSASTVDVMDLVYQLLRIGFSLVPVALAFFLLSSGLSRARDRLGLVWGRASASVPRDLLKGAGLAALIGIPGLGLYVVGRALGQNVKIDTSGLPEEWWAALVLILAALAAALLEETVAVGYLLARLGEMRWRVPAAITASALLRGSYHLYQGWPMALGNVVMGIVFALAYLRWKRLGPLIAAHAFLDLVSFVGPEIVPAEWLEALHLA
ncbi:MAG: CPBP family intramembrane metalloprotease [Demequinaceae bacterium]|nr:CPBP family intramembrane metalloprotease [Demequinaceae bacterium]